MKTLKTNQRIIILLILGLALRLFLSIQTYSGDVNNHVSWGKDMITQGPSGIYEREFMSRYGTLTPTYPPIPLYLFTAGYYLYDVTYKTAWKLNLSYKIFPSRFIIFLEDQDTLPAFLKLPGILADIALAYAIYLFCKKLYPGKRENLALLGSSLILFNPAFFYNSAYWGQIEAIPLFFAVVSFYFFWYLDKPLEGALFFALSLLTKQSMIIFIPVYGLTYLKKYGWNVSIKSFLPFLTTFVLLFLPFYPGGNLLTFPFTTYWNKIQTGSGSDYVVDHAFNFWSLTTGLGKIHDSLKLIVLSYQTWGYLLFGIALFVIVYKLFRSKKINAYIFTAALYLSGFASFLFLTRMHERYLEYALPFFLLISVKDKKMLYGFLFLSLFNFLNLYHNWWSPRIGIVETMLSNVLVVNVLTLAAIGLFVSNLLKYHLGKLK